MEVCDETRRDTRLRISEMTFEYNVGGYMDPSAIQSSSRTALAPAHGMCPGGSATRATASFMAIVFSSYSQLPRHEHSPPTCLHMSPPLVSV